MSDHADNADNKIYRTIAAGLAASRRAKSLQPDGCCHFCDQVVVFGQVFCNAGCRDDFERVLNAKKGPVSILSLIPAFENLILTVESVRVRFHENQH